MAETLKGGRSSGPTRTRDLAEVSPFRVEPWTPASWGTFLFVPGGGRTQRLALCSRGFKDPSRSGRGHHRDGGKRVRPEVVPLLAKSGLRVSHAVERRERLGSNWSVNVHHDLASRGVLGSSCTTPPSPLPPQPLEL